MNKNIKNVVLSAAVLFMATGCGEEDKAPKYEECTFEEFNKAFLAAQNKAEEEIKNPNDAVLTFTGRIDDKRFNFKSDDLSSSAGITEQIAALSYVTYALDAYTLAATEDKSATYYAGSTFKIEKEDVTFEFDEYALLTYVNDTEDKISMSISYKF